MDYSLYNISSDYLNKMSFEKNYVLYIKLIIE